MAGASARAADHRPRYGGRVADQGGTFHARPRCRATRYVVDASVAVEYLPRTPLGLAAADTLEGADLIAPELIDVEVLSALRKAVLLGRLDESRALAAVKDLSRWPVDRVSHRALARLAWRYRHNVSAYDAFYLATARSHAVPLLTADGKLAGASGLDVTVQHIFGSPRHVMEP